MPLGDRRFTARLQVLPLVNKRWARVMKTSTLVWDSACFDAWDIVVQRREGRGLVVCSVDLAVMTAWFHARPGRFTDLGLKTAHSTAQLPSGLTPILLSTQAASLRQLSLDVTACGFPGHELEILTVISGLTALDVHLIGCGLDDYGAAIFRAASSLTALQHLELSYVPDPGTKQPLPQGKFHMPRCWELSKLRSQSLHTLSVAMTSGHVLRLAGLVSLRECHLLGDNRDDGVLRIDLSSFASCVKLEELTLHHHEKLSLELGCFDALPALTSLTLTDCGLTSVPLAVAPLTTLVVLNLSRNMCLDVDKADTALLRGLTLLRALDLAKPEQAVQVANSMQAVFDLVEACRDDGQLLHVNFDPELSETYEVDTAYFGAVSD